MRLCAILLLLFVTNNAYASPQSPDFLIIGSDTVSIYSLPLESYLQRHKDNYINHIRSEDERMIALNLWRGYQGVWKLENNNLYLINLIGLDDPVNVLQKTFAQKYHDGKVLAEWFNSSLSIGKGDLLKWDGIFGRTYVTEEIFKFRNGRLIDNQIITNFIHLPSSLSRSNRKIVADTIFNSIKKLNWANLSKCECDDEYYMTINQFGKIDRIKFVPYLDTKWQNFWYSFSHRKCIRKIRKNLNKLQFDIIKWNGKPYKEQVRVEIFYNSGTKELENWTNTNE